MGVLGLAAGLMGCDRGPESGVAFTPTITFGEVGAGPGQFSYPRSLDVEERDGTALIWVVDKLARIQCINADTGASVGSFRTPAWELGKPTGITAWRSTNAAFDPAITGVEEGARTLLFVADTHYHRVLIYDARLAMGGSMGVAMGGGGLKAGETSPEPLLRIGAYGKGPGEMIYPTDVAVLEDGRGGIARLYVSEYGSNDRISMYEPKGERIEDGFEFVGSFGTFGAGGDAKVVEFNRPQSIEVDAARGWLVVTDACNHRVGVLTLEGKPIRWMGEYEPGGDPAVVPDGVADAADGVGSGVGNGVGNGGGEGANSGAVAGSAHSSRVRLRYPYGLALRSDGTALVSEFGAARVHLIDLERGESLGTFGVRGTGPGELSAPWSVGLAHGDTRVLVLDSGNNRVQGFELGPMVRGVKVGGAMGGRTGTDAHGSATP